MDSKKADRLLDRINALHKSLSPLDENDVSGIEKDLMLSYLRQLYEIYQSTEPAKKVATPLPEKAPDRPTPAKPIEEEQPTETKATVTAPPAAPTPPAQPAAAPPPPAAPVPRPVPPSPPEPTPTTAASSPPVRMTKELAELFASQKVKEIADRLGQQPIKDLTRALTINDRVQFANVLFGGNSELMNSLLKKLNGLGSLAAAKPVLAELAQEQDWTTEEKVPVARDFIKLVARRYA